MAFAVVCRTGEMGISIALGAGRRRVLPMILREALLLVLVGVAIGVPAALMATRLASSQTVRSALRVERARLDPVTALRDE